MGFLDSLNNFAGEVKAKQQRMEKELEEESSYLSDMPDKKLIQRYKTSHGVRKAACAQELKRRGYGNG